MRIQTKIAIYLMVLAVLDTVIPVPITVGILIYVVLEKPKWFKKMVAEVYAA